MTQHLAVAASLAALIALPHFLPLHRVAPTTAGAVWFLALGLRAIAAVGAAVYVLAYLPETALFAGAGDWCLHLALPVGSISVHVPGLRLARAIAVVPTLALAASLAWTGFGLLRARLYTQRLVRKLAVGAGPLGSTVLATDEVLLAITRVGPPRLLVSGTALETLDGDELAAALQHELGHLRRAHRPVLLAASVLRALARLQPRSGAAYRELCFSLERDADEYALAQTRDPLALASAICKAALHQRVGLPAIGLGGQGRVALRLEHLLAGGRRRAGPRVERAAQLLAASMFALMLLVAAIGPVWALARPGSLPHIPGSSGWNC